MAYYGATYDSGDPTTKYDPNDTANFQQGKNGVFKDGSGRSYIMGPDGTRQYLSSYADAQQAHNNEGFFSNQEFNPSTGAYDSNLDWGNILGILATAAPFAAAGGAALAGAGAGGAGGGGGAAATGAGAGTAAGGSAAGAAGGVLPSTGFMGAGVLPSGAASSLMGAGGSAAVGTGLAAAKGAGTLSKIGKAGQGLYEAGDIASQAAGGLANGRRADAQASNYAAGINNRSNLDAAEFNMGAPVTRAKQVAQGDLMSYNFAPASHTGSGRDLQISGGVGPWAFSQTTRDAGDALKRQALSALLNGTDKVTPQQATGSSPSGGEDALGYAGLGLGILGTLARYR